MIEYVFDEFYPIMHETLPTSCSIRIKQNKYEKLWVSSPRRRGSSFVSEIWIGIYAYLPSVRE